MMLSSLLISYEFCQSKVDPSIYARVHDGQLLALSVYVDNLLYIHKKRELLMAFKQEL